jgi:UTP--glucose-1-phosphate uridylyltransferase
VFTPEIFDALESIDVPPGDEVQLTEAISKLAGFQTVYAHVYEGQRFDIGDKLEYLRATVEVAAAREDLGPAFRAFLREFCARNGIIA